jgi:hypothetical protein
MYTRSVVQLRWQRMSAFFPPNFIYQYVGTFCHGIGISTSPHFWAKIFLDVWGHSHPEKIPIQVETHMLRQHYRGSCPFLDFAAICGKIQKLTRGFCPFLGPTAPQHPHFSFFVAGGFAPCCGKAHALVVSIYRNESLMRYLEPRIQKLHTTQHKPQ